jgi:hypothetical protein
MYIVSDFNMMPAKGSVPNPYGIGDTAIRVDSSLLACKYKMPSPAREVTPLSNPVLYL